MRIALTRAVSPRLAECELTHLPRRPIDGVRAAAQHRAYEAALTQLGCTVRELPPLDDMPDGVFVEDAAIVLDEIAIVTRPGAVSRRAETASVAAALASWRPVATIEAPATLDGGDILRVGRTLIVGRSARTNEAAITQLRSLVAPHGCAVNAVEVTGSLHPKSAVTAVGGDALVVNRTWLDASALAAVVPGATLIDVDPDEPGGANHVLVGAQVLSPASCPRTVERLRAHGIDGTVVDVSELEKAEAAVTCCSLVFDI